MGATTNRNQEAGLVLQLHGRLQEQIFWIDCDTGNVVEGTFEELGEMCDRPYKVPSPLGVDFKYHLDRESGRKVMVWRPDGKEDVAFEFDDSKEALAKLEDIWREEICESDHCESFWWRREDAQEALESWQEEQDAA